MWAFGSVFACRSDCALDPRSEMEPDASWPARIRPCTTHAQPMHNACTKKTLVACLPDYEPTACPLRLGAHWGTSAWLSRAPGTGWGSAPERRSRRPASLASEGSRAGRQLPPRLALGHRRPQARASARMRPGARDPHARARLAPSSMYQRVRACVRHMCETVSRRCPSTISRALAEARRGPRSLRSTIRVLADSDALSGWPPSKGGAGSYSIPS